MGTDIRLISEAFRRFGRGFTVTQLKVVHPGVDDDGLWFFRKEGTSIEVQLESSSGDCPFLIESNQHPDRKNARTVAEAIDILLQEFGVPR